MFRGMDIVTSDSYFSAGALFHSETEDPFFGVLVFRSLKRKYLNINFEKMRSLLPTIF